MKAAEIEKSKEHNLTENIEFVPNSIASKAIIQKTTGDIIAIAIDAGEVLEEKASPYDTYIQIIEGKAEIVIDERSNLLLTGQAIIIPAHASKIIRANERLKMISTVIKSGYEENLL